MTRPKRLCKRLCFDSRMQEHRIVNLNNLQIALMKYSTMFDVFAKAIVGATDAAFSLINAIGKLIPGFKATKPFKQKTTAPLTNQQQGERASSNKILIGEQ